MNPSYADIIDRAGEPSWWGPGGVPRYGAFDPDALSIYATQAALYEIACQACGQRFRVAESWDRTRWLLANLASDHNPDDYSIRARLERGVGMDYGDPPNVDCCPAGPCMSSLFVRLLEFHERASGCEWQRVPEVEACGQIDETDDDGAMVSEAFGTGMAIGFEPDPDNPGETRAVTTYTSAMVDLWRSMGGEHRPPTSRSRIPHGSLSGGATPTVRTVANMHSAALVDEVVRALRRPRPIAPGHLTLPSMGGLLWGAPGLVTLSAAGDDIAVDVPGDDGAAWRLGSIRGSVPVLEVTVDGELLVAATGELAVARAVVALAAVWRHARRARGG